jgi:hypothetical protein
MRVPSGDQLGAPDGRDGKVGHDTADPRPGVVIGAHPLPLPVGNDERVLRDVLGDRPVSTEHVGQTDHSLEFTHVEGLEIRCVGAHRVGYVQDRIAHVRPPVAAPPTRPVDATGYPLVAG